MPTAKLGKSVGGSIVIQTASLCHSDGYAIARRVESEMKTF